MSCPGWPTALFSGPKGAMAATGIQGTGQLIELLWLPTRATHRVALGSPNRPLGMMPRCGGVRLTAHAIGSPMLPYTSFGLRLITRVVNPYRKVALPFANTRSA